MEITYFQSSILAIIQGLTEFLPISSSAHLLLPSQWLGWPDQGLAFDVMVHLGTLLAAVVYFRADLSRLIIAWLTSWSTLGNHWKHRLAHGSQGADLTLTQEPDAVLAWCLLLATLPAAVAGLLFQELLSAYARSGTVVAATSTGYGLLLLAADALGSRTKGLDCIGWRNALVIGFAQALALVPGTSRSGVTMSAALALGFTRVAAARFSFLMAIPIIAASSALQIGMLVHRTIDMGQWLQMATALLLSAVTAFSCIHWFLRLVVKVGFLPFVVYRLLLAAVLVVIAVP